MIKIETTRLILREFEVKDADDVFSFASNKEVSIYTGEEAITEKSQALDIIEKTWFVDYAKYGYGRWAVIHKPDNKGKVIPPSNK